MRLKMKPIGEKNTELFDEFGQRIIKLESVTDGDGTLRATAVIDTNLARDIIKGLALLDAVRASKEDRY